MEGIPIRKNLSGDPTCLTFDTFVSKDGRTFFLLKETLRKDFIIRYENKALWINNQRFYSAK
jgi:hypothetical protein